jgi:hypothetical protein
MVELAPTAEGEKWHAQVVDLEAVAKVIGTHGKGYEQRQRHLKERRMHSRSLTTGRNSETITLT